VAAPPQKPHPLSALRASNLYTTFVQLILTKIITIVATRCHILRLRCTKFDFDWGSAPDPAGELTALPRLPSWWGGAWLPTPTWALRTSPLLSVPGGFFTNISQAKRVHVAHLFGDERISTERSNVVRL